MAQVSFETHGGVEGKDETGSSVRGGWHTNGNTVNVCAVAGTRYKVENDYTVDKEGDLYFDAENHRLVYSGPGAEAVLSMSWSVQVSNGCELNYHLFKNGVETDRNRPLGFQTALVEGMVCGDVLVPLDNGDYLELYVSTDSPNVTVTSRNVQLVSV